MYKKHAPIEVLSFLNIVQVGCQLPKKNALFSSMKAL